MNPNGPIPDPDLAALLQAQAENVFASLRCHALGTVVSFDEASQTATVRINAQAVVYNQRQSLNAPLQATPQIVDYPPLTDVPVFVLSGGGFAVTLPVAAGDTCLVCFNDRDFDAWFQSGASTPPNSGRMHSLSDGLALVGFRSRANPIAGLSSTEAALRNAAGDAKVAIDGDGNVAIRATDGGKANFTADVALESDGGGKLTLDDKVCLANASGDLRAAMDLVITALTALNAKTGPSAALPIAAAQTALQDLLRS